MKNISRRLIIVFLLLALQAMPVAGFATVQSGWQQAGWLDNFEAAAEKARAGNRPLLVYFDALWCSWCQQYRREVLDRPDVQSFIQRHYVAVVVDFDARPDLFSRFGGVGLPFTVVLSAQGRPVNRFVGVLSEANFLAMLQDSMERSGLSSVSDSDIFDVVYAGEADRASYQRFRQAFLQHVDQLYSAQLATLAGQYESGATLKRPSPQTWWYLTKHGLWPQRVKKAVLAERDRLLDRQHGGFFNFLDSSGPEADYLESAKLLGANAWLIAWFASAAQTMPVARAVAEQSWFYLRDVLWDEKQGGFWQAQVADNEYYALAAAERLKRSPPPVDKIKRADTNAQAAIALHRAGRELNNAEMRHYAAQTLDFVVAHLMPGDVLFHVRDAAGESVLAFPQDWFWLLLAAQEVGNGDQQRERKLKLLAKQAGAWLQQQMNKKSAAPLPPELIALIAASSCRPDAFSQLPESTCVWALRQLRIEAETPPDVIVPGLLAWQAYLAGTAVH